MIKNDVKNISIKKAAFINAAANYSCVILQLGFSAVLARILLPAVSYTHLTLPTTPYV